MSKWYRGFQSERCQVHVKRGVPSERGTGSYARPTSQINWITPIGLIIGPKELYSSKISDSTCMCHFHAIVLRTARCYFEVLDMVTIHFYRLHYTHHSLLLGCPTSCLSLTLLPIRSANIIVVHILLLDGMVGIMLASQTRSPVVP